MKKKLSKKEKLAVLSYFKERFGITEGHFKDKDFFKTQDKIYITTEACLKHPLFQKAETAGLAVIRPNGIFKPTTDALQLYGKFATKNTFELSKEAAEKFIRGEDMEFDSVKEAETETQDLESGYVIIKYKGHILGCANLKQGMLKNMLPKSRRIRVKIQ